MAAELQVVGAGGIDARGVVGSATGRRTSDVNDLLALRWRDVGHGAYPAFRRFDELARALAIATDAAGVTALAAEHRATTGLWLVTEFGCLAADVRFARGLAPAASIEPAVFPYTLPSTALAEVAIRSELGGPLGCFVAPVARFGAVLTDVADEIAAGGCDTAVVCIGDAVTPDVAAAVGIAPRVALCALVVARGTPVVGLPSFAAVAAAADPVAFVLDRLHAKAATEAGPR